MLNKLRRGDWVEVKNAEEILNSLNEEGKTDGLSFMPEMIQYCGRRFLVDKRAEKICDTLQYSGSRRLHNTVLLEELRCDGSAHDDCQADCRLFWKEIWLTRIIPGMELSQSIISNNFYDSLKSMTVCNIKSTNEIEGKSLERYQCQLTDLYYASTPLKLWDPFPYIREFSCGNVPFRKFLRISIKAFFVEPLRILGFFPHIFLKGTDSCSLSEDDLDLHPGDYVQVKSKDEIAKTLNSKGGTRGLWFDREMVPYCTGTYRVRKCIKQFIHDDGRMIKMKRGCVTLEGVFCSGELSMRRWFCARLIFPFWRESWLRRVTVESPSSSTDQIQNPG